jgi:hypothetical protein
MTPPAANTLQSRRVHARQSACSPFGASTDEPFHLDKKLHAEGMPSHECNLTAERVKAGLRNARANGKRLRLPQVAVDAPRLVLRHLLGTLHHEFD